jgi:hypothetical protein
MNTQHWQFHLNNFKQALATAMGVVLMSFTAPLSAQVINTDRGFGTAYPIPANNAIVNTNSIPASVNSSIVYGSPIPRPVIIYPSNVYSSPGNFYSYPSNFYSYPSYYPGSIDKTTLTNPVLVNPTIRDSTLINPTIINIQPQRRNRLTESNQRIFRPRN